MVVHTGVGFRNSRIEVANVSHLLGDDIGSIKPWSIYNPRRIERIVASIQDNNQNIHAGYWIHCEISHQLCAEQQEKYYL